MLLGHFVLKNLLDLAVKQTRIKKIDLLVEIFSCLYLEIF